MNAIATTTASRWRSSSTGVSNDEFWARRSQVLTRRWGPATTPRRRARHGCVRDARRGLLGVRADPAHRRRRRHNRPSPLMAPEPRPGRSRATGGWCARSGRQECEDAGRGGRGGGERVDLGDAGDLDGPADALGQGRGRPGDGPTAGATIGQPGHAARHLDLEGADRVGAVTQAGRRHRVGDERDVLGPDGLEDHPHDVGSDVHPVGDELDDAVAARRSRERRRDRTSGAVVKGRHTVEEVGHERCATTRVRDRDQRGGDDVRRRVRVPDGREYAVSRQCRDQPPAPARSGANVHCTSAFGAPASAQVARALDQPEVWVGEDRGSWAPRRSVAGTGLEVDTGESPRATSEARVATVRRGVGRAETSEATTDATPPLVVGHRGRRTAASCPNSCPSAPWQ